MKDMFIGEDGMSSNTVEERLQHALARRYHGGVFLRLGLLHSIIADSLFRRDGRNDECWVQFDEIRAQRLKFGISVVRDSSLRNSG